MRFLSIAFLVLYTVAFARSRTIVEDGDHLEGDIAGISSAFYTRSGLLNERFRWPDGIIPYTFASGYPDNLRRNFMQAINHISEYTCIEFVPRSNEKDYIEVFAGDGCYATIGRAGGRQDVSLPSSCPVGTFVHELIHSIGFFHEQARPDRDDFVRINRNNVIRGKEHNFDKQSASRVTTFGVGYDFGSIMHYPARAFSSNGRDTITTIPAGQSIGQRRAMSQRDVLKINRMYNCE